MSDLLCPTLLGHVLKRVQSLSVSRSVWETPPVKGTTVRHYKGGIYTVVAVASHSETSEQLVVYQAEDGCVWVRPFDMFTGTVEHEGNAIPRFVRVVPDGITNLSFTDNEGEQRSVTVLSEPLFEL